MNVIKVCDFLLPTNKVINDNKGSDWREISTDMKWLSDHVHIAVDSGNDLFCEVANINDVNSVINKDKFGVIINHFKLKQKFDLMNYERTTKSIIDALTGYGYFEDDCHMNLNPAIMIGGDYRNLSNNFLNLKDQVFDISTEEEMDKYFEDRIPSSFRARSNCKKNSQYDVFQIYAFNT